MSSTQPSHLALKEWASVVLAVESGVQDILLRKGGIDEDRDGFVVAHTAFLLFPTYFHQQKSGVRAECQHLVERAFAEGPPAGRLILRSWAEVKRTWVIGREADLVTLEARHIYTRGQTMQRLHGVYGKELHAIEVAVHALPTPIELPMRSSYGGCRSWVDLEPG